MKRLIFAIAMAAAAVFIFSGCIGGGGDGGGLLAGGGTGGSGSIISGQITAKGSIIVNGVKYETVGAQILVDGVSVSNDDSLKVGMIVEIEGSVNADGISGNATAIRFNDSVDGPIASIDAAARKLEVLGQSVLVDDRTVYDDSSVSPPNLSGLSAGDVIEVSGQIDDLGNIRATYIEKKPLGAEVEVTGFVSAKSGSTFKINNLTVDFSLATLSDFGGGEPIDGDFVEVKGLAANYNAGTNTLVAASVENKARDFDDGNEAEVEGFIDSLTVGGFTIVVTSGRIQVKVDGATVFSGGTADDLKVGMKVEAEGQISSGVLLADKVDFRDNVRVEVAAAQQSDGDPLTVELRGLPVITVRVDDRTRLEDKRSGASTATGPADLLASILENDALKIRGRLTGSDVLATELEVDDPDSDLDRVELRGPVDNDPGDTRFLEILGVTIDTDGASFEDINGIPLSRTGFFDTAAAGSIVEAKGDLTPSVDDRIDAAEVELED